MARIKKIKVALYRIEEILGKVSGYSADIYSRRKLKRISESIPGLARGLENLENDLGHNFGVPVEFKWQHPNDENGRTGFNNLEIFEFLDNYKWNHYYRFNGA